MDGAPAEFEYSLAESATASIVQGKSVLWRSDLQQRFPKDTLLQSVRAEACVGVPLTDNNAHPIGVVMALFRRSVTSLRTARELLEIFAKRASSELASKLEADKIRESDQRYRAFISKNADAMWRIEFPTPIQVDLPETAQFDLIYQTGYLAECNDALARLLGFEKAEQLIGRSVGEICPASEPSVRDATMIAIRARYKLTTVETNPVDSAGKRRHMLRSQWGIVENGGLERIWGSTRDISDVKLAETALDASEQRMADLISAMHLLVVMLRPNGAVSFCNGYFYELTGWLPQDLIGRNWIDDAIPPEEHSRVRAEFTHSSGEPDTPIHFESALLSRDGHKRHIAWDSTLLRGNDYSISARALIGRDISDFRSLEEQFRQAQKLAGIGRLAGSVAHDFNNLLTVILGYAEAELDQLEASDPGYDGLLGIRRAAEEGAELSRRLLTFSRRQKLRPQTIKLNTFIDETRQMLSTLLGSEIPLITNLNPDAGYVLLDTGYFHHVLFNLAINARDAMPRGGMLTIATTNVRNRRPSAI